MNDETLCDECKLPCTGGCDDNDCPVGAMSELEQMRVFGNGCSGAGYELFYRIVKGLKRARLLHPKFAEGKYQALGRIGAEYGELVQAVEKCEGTQREKDELIDLIVVSIRAWLDEHEATA